MLRHGPTKPEKNASVLCIIIVYRKMQGQLFYRKNLPYAKLLIMQQICYVVLSSNLIKAVTLYCIFHFDFSVPML